MQPPSKVLASLNPTGVSVVRDACELFATSGAVIHLDPSEKATAEVLRTEERIDFILVGTRGPHYTELRIIEQAWALRGRLPSVIVVADQPGERLETLFVEGVEALFLEPVPLADLMNAIALSEQDQKGIAKRLLLRSRLHTTHVEWTNPVTGELVKGYALNLSLGGLFIHTNVEMPLIGQEISFRVIHRSHPPVEFSSVGLVRWLRPDPGPGRPRGFGVEFNALEAESYELFRKFKPGR